MEFHSPIYELLHTLEQSGKIKTKMWYFDIATKEEILSFILKNTRVNDGT